MFKLSWPSSCAIGKAATVLGDGLSKIGQAASFVSAGAKAGGLRGVLFSAGIGAGLSVVGYTIPNAIIYALTGENHFSVGGFAGAAVGGALGGALFKGFGPAAGSSMRSGVLSGTWIGGVSGAVGSGLGDTIDQLRQPGPFDFGRLARATGGGLVGGAIGGAIAGGLGYVPTGGQVRPWIQGLGALTVGGTIGGGVGALVGGGDPLLGAFSGGWGAAGAGGFAFLGQGAANRGNANQVAQPRQMPGQANAPVNPAQRRVLYHYTDEAGMNGITQSGELRPSLRANNPRDVRYGEGQYMSDIAPGTRTPAQLSREFLGQPFQGRRFTHYVEIDVTGLDVVQGRNGVFVVPGNQPLDLTGRIVGSGAVPPVGR